MIDVIKKNFATLIQGLMFGFGFCIAAWVLYFAFQGEQHQSSTVQYGMNNEAAIQKKESVFSFHNVEEIIRNDRTYFVGIIKNNGSSIESGTHIEVNLFYKGKFVDQYSTYLSGSLHPGEERFFKISCGCKDTPPAEHDSYKIEVVGGY